MVRLPGRISLNTCGRSGSILDGGIIQSTMGFHRMLPGMGLGPPITTRSHRFGCLTEFSCLVAQIRGMCITIYGFCEFWLIIPRLDRLISILINAYFPFYEHVPQKESRAKPDLEKQLIGGLNRWEVNCIRPCPDDSIPPAHRHLFGTNTTVYCVLPPRRSSGTVMRPQYCGRSARNGREACTCKYSEQAGKRCVHLWSMVTFELCGPVSSFEENASTILDRLNRSRKETTSEDIFTSNHDSEDFKTYWGDDLNTLSALTSIDLDGPPIAGDQLSPPAMSTLQHDREISPIGRRHRMYENESDHRIEPVPVADLFKPLPGRPSHIRPLDPYRSNRGNRQRSQRSSLAIPMKKLAGIVPPTGLINSGVDCYVLALFQVLFRLPLWLDRFTTAMTEGHGRADPVLAMLSRFESLLRNDTAQPMPQLREILFGTSESCKHNDALGSFADIDRRQDHR